MKRKSFFGRITRVFVVLILMVGILPTFTACGYDPYGINGVWVHSPLHGQSHNHQDNGIQTIANVGSGGIQLGGVQLGGGQPSQSDNRTTLIPEIIATFDGRNVSFEMRTLQMQDNGITNEVMRAYAFSGTFIIADGRMIWTHTNDGGLTSVFGSSVSFIHSGDVIIFDDQMFFRQ